MAAANDESSLVLQSQQGDHEAFETLITEYQRMIYSLCYRMTGSMADAEDLAQETFLQAYQHLGGFRAKARFSSWLYRIAMNQCLNWQKRQARQTQVYREWSEHATPSPEENHENSQWIQSALMKLHPKQRAAIVLTIYDGLSHAEAARALGCSETTISWRVFVARAKLKKLLSNSQKLNVNE